MQKDYSDFILSKLRELDSFHKFDSSIAIFLRILIKKGEAFIKIIFNKISKTQLIIVLLNIRDEDLI